MINLIKMYRLYIDIQLTTIIFKGIEKILILEYQNIYSGRLNS